MTETGYEPGHEEPMYDGGPGHGDRDIRTGWLLAIGGVLAALTLGAAIVSSWLFDAFASGRLASNPPPPVIEQATQPALVPEPRLLARPEKVLDVVRARERRSLGTYAWVDEGTGVARIPIERAMEIVAEQGLEGISTAIGQTPPGPEPAAGEPPAADEGVDG